MQALRLCTLLIEDGLLVKNVLGVFSNGCPGQAPCVVAGKA